MYLLQLYIVSGDKNYLIDKFIINTELSPDKRKELETLSLETLVKKTGDLICYIDGEQPIKAPSINIYFLRKYKSLIKTLLSITNLPDHWCNNPREVIDRLKGLGMEIDEKREMAIFGMYVQAAFAFYDKILDMDQKQIEKEGIYGKCDKKEEKTREK